MPSGLHYPIRFHSCRPESGHRVHSHCERSSIYVRPPQSLSDGRIQAPSDPLVTHIARATSWQCILLTESYLPGRPCRSGARFLCNKDSHRDAEMPLPIHPNGGFHTLNSQDRKGEFVRGFMPSLITIAALITASTSMFPTAAIILHISVPPHAIGNSQYS